jgi:hypothetical protein
VVSTLIKLIFFLCYSQRNPARLVEIYFCIVYTVQKLRSRVVGCAPVQSQINYINYNIYTRSKASLRRRKETYEILFVTYSIEELSLKPERLKKRDFFTLIFPLDKYVVMDLRLSSSLELPTWLAE